MIGINEGEIKNLTTKQVTAKIEYLESKTGKNIGVITGDYDLWLKGFFSDKYFLIKLNELIKRAEELKHGNI